MRGPLPYLRGEECVRRFFVFSALGNRRRFLWRGRTTRARNRQHWEFDSTTGYPGRISLLIFGQEEKSTHLRCVRVACKLIVFALDYREKMLRCHTSCWRNSFVLLIWATIFFAVEQANACYYLWSGVLVNGFAEFMDARSGFVASMVLLLCPAANMALGHNQSSS